MTARERFRRTMAFEPVDRPPVLALEPYEESALRRWHTEGLPQGITPEEFLGMSRLVNVPVSFGPMPAFEEKVIFRDDRYEHAISSMGATLRRYRDNPSMLYGHIDHPVKTRADWDEYSQRFVPSTPGRIPLQWAESVAGAPSAFADPIGVCIFPFFFRLGFYALGMERFLSAFYEEPELIHRMFSDWSRFVIETIRPILQTVKLDYALLAEDLAGKNGPLVSPRTYAEFWHPYQDPVIRLLQDHNVPVICQWSAGQVEPLLPCMMQRGVNCTWPLEVVAGLQAADLRRRFGKALRLGGNIAKEAVIAGPQAIDREIERLMPVIGHGGVIPALDDMASPDMAFGHYRYLIQRLQAIRLDR